MRILILFLATALFSFDGLAQFQVGNTVITFNDPDREGGVGSGGGPGRQIETEVYYPAVQAANNAEVAEGSFPVVIIGHGFLMTVDAYYNYRDVLVPLGYIVALPKTETGFTPSHNDFGLDIAVVATDLRQLTENESSIFYGKIAPQAAVGGHSMGGGASVIAAQNADVDVYFSFAPAETNPSAVAAAASVNAHSLVFAGSADGVTPPADHQTPIYNALASNCKAYVTLEGGGHCYFANENGACDLGELFSSGGITLSRAEQQAMTYTCLLPWLRFWLQGDADAWEEFEAASEAMGVTTVLDCANAVGIEEEEAMRGQLYPNPANSHIQLSASFSSDAEFFVFRPNGRMVDSGNWSSTGGRLLVRHYTPGSYLLLITDGDSRKVFRFMKM